MFSTFFISMDNSTDNRRYESLYRRFTEPLSAHLERAIKDGRVGSRYSLKVEKKKGEGVREYATRLATDASEVQFVQSVFSGQQYYVAFGVPGPIITPAGKFMLIPAEVVGGRWGVHYFLFSPDFRTVLAQDNVFVRIDSGCISGQLFGDITCDCKEQFDISLRRCATKGGVVINIPNHDGRGWGVLKNANQELMDAYGVDTVTAANLFYGDAGVVDQRSYTEAVIILRALGFTDNHKFCIATNNPRKVGAFNAFGMQVESVDSVVAERINPILKKNLLAKHRKWRHNFTQKSSAGRNQVKTIKKA